MFSCPDCFHKTEVIDSRKAPRGTRRRRECKKCRKRFSTIESIAIKDKLELIGFNDAFRKFAAAFLLTQEANLEVIERFCKLVGGDRKLSNKLPEVAIKV